MEPNSTARKSLGRTLGDANFPLFLPTSSHPSASLRIRPNVLPTHVVVPDFLPISSPSALWSFSSPNCRPILCILPTSHPISSPSVLGTPRSPRPPPISFVLPSRLPTARHIFLPRHCPPSLRPSFLHFLGEDTPLRLFWSPTLRHNSPPWNPVCSPRS